MDGFKVYNALKYCPFCGRDLEIEPNGGRKACFVHGDFVVTDLKDDSTKIEFELMRFGLRDFS